MGLEKIHAVAKAGGYVLRMKLGDWTGDVATVQLPFRLGGRDSRYALQVQKDGALSPLETSLGTDAAAGLPFSTRDQDHDRKGDVNCAKQLSGECPPPRLPSAPTPHADRVFTLLLLLLPLQAAGGSATAGAPT